jgi:hypothetical protein
MKNYKRLAKNMTLLLMLIITASCLTGTIKKINRPILESVSYTVDGDKVVLTVAEWEKNKRNMLKLQEYAEKMEVALGW